MKPQAFACVFRMLVCWTCMFTFVTAGADAADPQLKDQVQQALKKAATFYRSKVATRGGYVYYYSVDLQQRWGEGKATPDTVFVQPPGTPTVGMAYLKAYEATGDKYYLDAAREAGEALAYGQLQSGGWTQTIRFEKGERTVPYRDGKDTSSLDDGQTQSALIMLTRVDRALDLEHKKIHEASTQGLSALLKAQFPIGAFPQIWRAPVKPQPVAKAKYPDYDWKTEGRLKNYWDYYTLNDGLAGTVSNVLIEAHGVYKDDKYKAALAKLGDFLISAQMPDPQPGWCQQYNYDMVPIWARKFEPPAITAWEAQDVMETLIKIYYYTGDKKYLEPVPKALAYYKKCLLPDGRVARYYEFKTNKPLYMDENYKLTYDDSAAPSHYGWKQSARFDQIEKAYTDAKNGIKPQAAKSSSDLEANVRMIVKDLDDEGRWVSTFAGERLVGQPKFAASFRYISSDVFSKNIETLSEFVATSSRQ